MQCAKGFGGDPGNTSSRKENRSPEPVMVFGGLSRVTNVPGTPVDLRARAR
jgi:hypothetical protein